MLLAFPFMLTNSDLRISFVPYYFPSFHLRKHIENTCKTRVNRFVGMAHYYTRSWSRWLIKTKLIKIVSQLSSLSEKMYFCFLSNCSCNHTALNLVKQMIIHICVWYMFYIYTYIYVFINIKHISHTYMNYLLFYQV